MRLPIFMLCLCTAANISLDSAAQERYDLQLERLPPSRPMYEPPTDSPVWNVPTGSPAPWGTSAPWGSPTSWYQDEVWDISVELGINGGAGNAESFSMKTGADIKYETDTRLFKYDISYARTKAQTGTTQDLFIYDARSEWKFLGSPSSLFFNHNATRDRFRDWDWRITLNAGWGYKVLDTELTKLKARFGAGTSRELGGLDDEWKWEAVIGMDYERQLSKKQKLTGTVDYFPEWSDFQNYRMNAAMGWEIILDEDPDLSLKIEASNRYDSTPNGLKPNDMTYSLLLLWKL